MSEKVRRGGYVGKWSPQRGFDPPDLENLVVLPEDATGELEFFAVEPRPQVCVDSWEEGDDISVAQAIELIKERKRQLSVKIEVAPGYRLHRLLSSICPPKFRERELDALLADATELYHEKLSAGDHQGARRVKWAMQGWLLWTVFGGALRSIASLLVGRPTTSK